MFLLFNYTNVLNNNNIYKNSNAYVNSAINNLNLKSLPTALLYG